MAKTLSIRWAAAAAVVVLAGCGTAAMAPPAALKDGQLTLPADYKSWPRFLSTIDKAEAKQVREIYMNPAATRGTAAAGFPNGSRFVMEIYGAATQADGSLQKDASGRLVKGPMAQVFMMGKEAGWGQDVAEPLRNGNWIYTAFTPEGAAKGGDAAACRGCHVPLKSQDYVFHAERWFASK